MRRRIAAPANLTGALLLACAGSVQLSYAQATKAPSSVNGGGHASTAGVRTPFNPGVTDENGKVIPAIPDRRPPNDEEGPSLTEKGKADKALAEQHKAPGLTKPAPKLIGDAKPLQKAKPWRLAEGRPEEQNAGAESSDFVGVDDTDTEPPDVAMAAGPNQIVAAANFTVNTWDKTGTLLGSQSFSSFFSPLGGFASWFIFDPVVTYDSYMQRFWLIATARNDSSNGSVVLIALSNSSDPSLAGWTFWWVDFTIDGNSATTNWCDYPHVGYDTQAIYMSCNQFNFPSSSGSFQYAKVRLMAKSQFLSNTCCSWWDHWNLKEGTLNLSTSFAVQPATMRLAANANGEFLVDAQGGGGSGSDLQVWHFPDPIGNPGQLDSASIGTSNYGPAPSAQQPFGVTGIDTGDARLLFANWENGHLSTGQNSNCNSRSCAGFYEVDVSGFSNLSMVNDWALQSTSEDFYYPSVDQNFNADKIMVFSRSSSSVNAGADYAAIPNSGNCTLCIGNDVSLAAGASTYSRVCCGNRNRWGDYFSASADPDGVGIWISGEFVSAMNVWATEIGSAYNTYAPVDRPSTTSLSFGNRVIGTSTQFVVNFANTGNANLNIGSVAITGADFSQSGNCASAALEPGSNCEVTVTFLPTAAVFRTGTLFVYDNTPSSPHTVSLSGQGVVGTPAVSLSAASLNFVGVPLGSKATENVTVTNTGTAVLSIGNIAITGAFTQVHTCGATLAPQASCVISVSFSPTTTATQTGTLTIADNATPNTQTVSLRGSGGDFTIGLSPTAISVSRGKSGGVAVGVAAVNHLVGTVSLACALPRGSTLKCSFTPAKLVFGKTSPLTSKLVVSTSFLTPTGTYSIPVGGSIGGLLHTAILKVTVQ